MTTPVPVCLQCVAISSSFIGSPNGSNQYQCEFNIANAGTANPTYQFYNSGGSLYDMTSIIPGLWISGTLGGFAWKIISVTGGNSAGVDSTQYVTLVIEDEENYNFNVDNGGGSGGQPLIGEPHLIFQLNSDGLPVTSPIYGQYTDQKLIQLSGDVIGRFHDRNSARQYVDVLQPSHTFVGGEPIWIDPADGYYKSANNTNAKYIVGVVSSVNIPTPDSFTYKVFGTYYYDIQKFFSALDLSSFNKGDFIYVSTDGVNNYTTTPPTDFAIPIWVYLGADSNGKQTGILYTTPSLYSGADSGGGGGGAGIQSYWINLNYVTGNTTNSNAAITSASCYCFLSSITTSSPLPSGWSITGPIGSSGINPNPSNFISFTNSNINSFSQSYASVPIFSQCLTLATLSNTLTSTALTTAIYAPFPFGNKILNSVAYPIPTSSNSIKIVNGHIIGGTSGLIAGGLNSGLASIGAIRQSNDANLPSTFFTAIKFNVLFPTI